MVCYPAVKQMMLLGVFAKDKTQGVRMIRIKLGCFVCLLVLCGGLHSAPAFAAIEGGNERRGEVIAREHCKVCHAQGAEAGTMTPLSRTQRQWERFYSKRRHDKIAPGAWADLSERDLLDTLQFMYNHAADSDQPSVCNSAG